MPTIASGDWNIVCDFDGTITPFDVTDAVLQRFAPPEWERIEDAWLEGEITARQCMESQVALINAVPEQLNAFLDTVPLTPGFKEFCSFCNKRGLNFLVVSDGLDYSINYILARHSLEHIPVRANHLRPLSGGRYKLEFPYGADACPSGICKCRVSGAGSKKILLIGDGLSDCCLADKAQFIMAKAGKELHKYSQAHNYPCLAYSDFFDIHLASANMLNAKDVLSEQAWPSVYASETRHLTTIRR